MFVAGGIVTTPRDYMSFLGALTRGELLEPAMLDEVLSNAFPLAAKSGILSIVTARVRSRNTVAGLDFLLARLLNKLNDTDSAGTVRSTAWQTGTSARRW